MDTVLNEFMRPVFPGEPNEVRRRLRAPYPQGWTYVLLGEEKRVISISEYIYQEKWDDAIRMLKELLRKQNLPIYQRDPSLIDRQIERTARKILDLGKGD